MASSSARNAATSQLHRRLFYAKGENVEGNEEHQQDRVLLFDSPVLWGDGEYEATMQLQGSNGTHYNNIDVAAIEDGEDPAQQMLAMERTMEAVSRRYMADLVSLVGADDEADGGGGGGGENHTGRPRFAMMVHPPRPLMMRPIPHEIAVAMGAMAPPLPRRPDADAAARADAENNHEPRQQRARRPQVGAAPNLAQRLGSAMASFARRSLGIGRSNRPVPPNNDNAAEVASNRAGQAAPRRRSRETEGNEQQHRPRRRFRQEGPEAHMMMEVRMVQGPDGRLVPLMPVQDMNNNGPNLADLFNALNAVNHPIQDGNPNNNEVHEGDHDNEPDENPIPFRNMLEEVNRTMRRADAAMAAGRLLNDDNDNIQGPVQAPLQENPRNNAGEEANDRLQAAVAQAVQGSLAGQANDNSNARNPALPNGVPRLAIRVNVRNDNEPRPGHPRVGFGAVPVPIFDFGEVMNQMEARPKWTLAQLQQTLDGHFAGCTILTMNVMEGSWERLSNEDWKRVCQTLAASLPNVTCLEAIYMENLSDMKWAELLSCFPNLTSLKFKHVGPLTETFRVIGTLKNLDCLSLKDDTYARTSSSGLSPEACVTLGKSLLQLTCLSKLTLQHLVMQDPRPCWLPLLKSIRKIPTVEVCSINGGWQMRPTGWRPGAPVVCHRINLNASNLTKVQYGPRICAARKLHLQDPEPLLKDWLLALGEVRDRIDCVHYFLTQMDPNMFAIPGIEAAILKDQRAREHQSVKQ